MHRKTEDRVCISRHHPAGRAAYRLGLLAACAVLSLAGAFAEITGGGWHKIGPAPINGLFGGGVSGRVSAIAVNPFNPDQIWIGAAAGGVWYSADFGATWTAKQTDDEATQAIGSLAVGECDATGCDKVYAGTGENAIRRDTYYGQGLLMGLSTSPGSDVWNWYERNGANVGGFLLGTINNIVRTADSSDNTLALYITLTSGVTASAAETTVTAPEPGAGYGIFKSLDEGTSWTKLTVHGIAGERPTSLERDPSNPNVLYAGFLGRGVFKSVNGGASWCPQSPGHNPPITCAATSGLPDPAQVVFDHVQIAVAPSNPQVVYASHGHCADPLIQNCVPSLYRSADGGENWTQQMAGSPWAGNDVLTQPRGYSRYTHALSVNPVNENILMMGGIRLLRSVNGGVSWGKWDHNILGSSQWGAILHLDHRDAIWDPTGFRLYDVGDGGVATSLGSGWTPRNKGLQVTGFQSLATSPLTYRIIGGTQDNGAVLWTGTETWDHMPCCGDAGFTAINPSKPTAMWAMHNFGSVKRSLDGGSSWCYAGAGLPDRQTEPRTFYAPFVQEQSPPHRVFWGAQSLYRGSASSGNKAICWDVDWEQISPKLSTSPQPEVVGGEDAITAIGVAPWDSNEIYIGYYSGAIYRASAPCNQPSCWEDIGATLPDAPITSIAVGPNGVLVSLSGFDPGSHVWKWWDSGPYWLPADIGIPGGIPANVVVHEEGGIYWAGLDANWTGSPIYYTSDNAQTWSERSTFIPNVPVYQIALDPAHNRAFAATHGRGAYLLGDTGGQFFQFQSWTGFGIGSIPVIGSNFPADAVCTLELKGADGTVCASSDTDAQGAAIVTDSEGRLVGNQDQISVARPMVWACFDGNCIGGPTAPCADPESVVATCDGVSQTAMLAPPLIRENPLSARLLMLPSTDPGLAVSGLAPEAGSGAPTGRKLQVSAVVSAVDGSSHSLCTVQVTVQPGDENDTIVAQAVDEMNMSHTCMAAGVTASMQTVDDMGDEDVFARNAPLVLSAPDVVGTQLLPALHAGPSGDPTGSEECHELLGLGIPVYGHLQTVAVRLVTDESGPMGGQITLREESPLGTCAVTVGTLAGETAEELATRIADAFNAPGIPGPHPDCPSNVNPRDVEANGDMLTTTFASRLTLCVADGGVGVSVGADGIDNLHPAALALAPAATECTGPGGATVLLDGSGSTDPDSSPGTNDDIILFEWFVDFGLASQALLGTGDLLSVPLALGSHDVTLVVTDSAGLQAQDTITVAVVDTTPPSLSGTAAPNLLWPANHTLVPVTASLVASDICALDSDLQLVLQSVTSNEPDDAPGASDGATVNDIRDVQPGTNDLNVTLRAERDINGAGRAYTLTYTTSDPSGNGAAAGIVVEVIPDGSGLEEPINITVTQSAVGTLLQWTPHEGASYYNILRGSLGDMVDNGDAYLFGSTVCIEAASADTDTLGQEDVDLPPPGEVWVYMVESANGYRSGYGTITAARPREIQPPDPCQ